MLIESNRHTPADLELWRELERADHKRDVCLLKARGELIRFTKAGDCYCSVSWGKDSVVIAWLVAKYHRNVPLVWVRPVGAEMPYCTEVRDAFLNRFDVEYFEPECPAEIWNDETVSNNAAFRPAREATGTDRRIVGVRASESGNRTMSMRVHGQTTDKVCRPIGWMGVEDVFAVLAQNDLPVHPTYGMLGGGRYDRNHLRVDSLGGPWADSFGRNEWEQEYYQDVINRRKHAACKSNR